ncbi:MAG TPA: efflux RND transporter periplasmic adaptor subunit [Acidobacteriaceae bacterium]|nr:efflux RND transporter periplasmic adaptor subunit [Acidobacteriaceae bacterium]
MNTPRTKLGRAGIAAMTLFWGCLLLGGCKAKETASREAAEAPPTTPAVVPVGQASQVQVGNPAQFQLVPVAARSTFASLNVTGQVQPDPAHEVPVLSLANGRVTALHADIGDYVHKGQLILDVQSPDVATAFATYLKAVADERLADTTLTRDKLLFDKGAIAQSQLQVAEDGEADAKADLKAADQQLAILGVDKNNPSDTVHVRAPISGVVISLNTTAAGAAGLTATGPNGSLVIADLSHVWVVCDVYENDLAQVHLGEEADITLSAFPGQVLRGTISDIGAILDPNIRTAKVRIQVPNPGNRLRVGLFATATFHGSRAQTALVVPADAILHLHDQDWVFVPDAKPGTFRRVAVHTGVTLPGNAVVVTSGLNEGQQVVGEALQLQEATEQ